MVEKQVSFQQIKQEMIEAGYEAREVHCRTARISDFDRCRFVVVRKADPEIDVVFYEPPDTLQVIPVVKQDFLPKWIIGWGETEDRAWQRAVAAWPDIPF
jgi:hypothetical protein